MTARVATAKLLVNLRISVLLSGVLLPKDSAQPFLIAPIFH
jgi:hypothetical protein